MIFYKLDYAVEKTLQSRLTAKQNFLKSLTGNTFSFDEAEYLTERISDHKWYVSEKLGRDIGTNVAAVDFFENIFEFPEDKKNSRHLFKMNIRSKIAMLS